MKKVIFTLLLAVFSLSVSAQSNNNIQDEVKKEVAAMNEKLNEVDITYALDKKTRMKLTTTMVSQKRELAKARTKGLSAKKIEALMVAHQGQVGKILGGARMAVLAGEITTEDGPGPSSDF